MSFLKVKITFSDRRTEVILVSKRFYHYVIETSVKQCRESGRTPVMFEASGGKNTGGRFVKMFELF